MPELAPAQRVYEIMQNLKSGKYQIPNIQRGYEWDPPRVLKLLDSIMSGYPIGAIMIWQPSEEIRKDIPTRPFIQFFDNTQDYLTQQPIPTDDDYFLVLDGQQRLQSLYISFFGSYNNKQVFLNLTSIPSDEEGDTDYGFEFLSHDEQLSRPEMIHLNSIVTLDIDEKYNFVEDLVNNVYEKNKKENDESNTKELLRKTITVNIERFQARFNNLPVLLFQEVYKKHNYDHVLEIFERVNSAGMVLTKSDLMFSTLKLKLQEMEQQFADTLYFINQGERYNFNTDFIIKSCLVIFNKGAKYEVKKLQDDEFIQSVKTRYSEFDYALRQLIAWLDDIALIKCDRFLRSRLALIPLLDFMILSGQKDKPDGNIAEDMKQYLYMTFFLRLFSRSADAMLDNLHNKIKENNPIRQVFPLLEIKKFMVDRLKRPYALQAQTFQDDVDLMLNIVDGGVLQIDPGDPKRHSGDLRLEVDHIFPKSPLSEMGMSDLVNHLGNYRLIVRPKNRRKGATMPDINTAFWGKDDPEINQKFLAALKNLNRDTFQAFRDMRANAIQKNVLQFLKAEMSN